MNAEASIKEIAVTWLGHATWLIEADGQRLLLDPFFTDNPAAQVGADAMTDIDYVIVSHGHFDHITDAESIAKANRCPIITNFEIANWFGAKGFGEGDLPAPIGMNLGGQLELPCGTIKMVPAVHSSGLPDGTYGGSPAGFVLSSQSQQLYFACDTAYFSDMRYYAHGVDFAVLPIGDLFTMGVNDSIEAIRIIEPRTVAPTHYGTWPPINQDLNAWAEKVREQTAAIPVELNIGQRHVINRVT